MQSDLWSPHSERAGVGLAPFAERPSGPVRFCDDDSDCAAGTFCGVYADSEPLAHGRPGAPTDGSHVASPPKQAKRNRIRDRTRVDRPLHWDR